MTAASLAPPSGPQVSLTARTWLTFAVSVILVWALASVVLTQRPMALPSAKLAEVGGRAAATGAPPEPAPVVLIDIPPERARAVNAAVPFVPGPHPAARPFRLPGGAEDLRRAQICLASAAWYEAGNDMIGQQAVVQVVLNRLRHPAFPKTVCGVVFEGSERTTGCQFTFTCDGALARVPAPDQWAAAMRVAERALSGFVFPKVGLSTHYHTDWVVPYWSASLDKIAEVHTHLFFRWKGWWGTPPAFRRRYLGDEKLPARLAALFAPEDAAAADSSLDTPGMEDGGLTAPRVALTVEGVPESALEGNVVRLIGGSGTDFVLELNPSAPSGSYAFVAVRLCKGKPVCNVTGWLDPTRVPTALPVPAPRLRTASFVYRRNAALSREQLLWNCIERVRLNSAQCLPGTERRDVAERAATPAAPPIVAPAPPPPPQPMAEPPGASGTGPL